MDQDGKPTANTSPLTKEEIDKVYLLDERRDMLCLSEFCHGRTIAMQTRCSW